MTDRLEARAPPGNADWDCDALIVGSGAGGAMTARVLAAAGRDVLVLEEGPDPDRVVEDPRASSTLPQLWRDGGIIPVLSNVKLALGEGRCLGGSTVVNAGLVHRTPAAALARWRVSGLTGLDDGALERHHELVDRELGVSHDGSDGSPVGRLLADASERCGFSGHVTPVAAALVDGRLRKNDARRTLLARAELDGARLVTDCRVHRIRWRGRAAEGVDAWLGRGAERRMVRVRCRALYLCGGALQTPLLLRRSGVRRGVGDRLQLHPMLRVLAQLPEPVDANAFPMATFQVDEFAPAIKLGASVSTPGLSAAGLSLSWPANRPALNDLRSVAGFYVSAVTDALGTVRNLPLESSLVRYRLDRVALRALSAGFAHLSRLLFAAGAVRLFPSVEGMDPITASPQADRFAQVDLPAAALNLVAVHAFGSCPMGADRSCPVDPLGRLRDVANVFVNDASVLPSSPLVNPQGPVMAMALRNLEAQGTEGPSSSPTRRAGRPPPRRSSSVGP